MEKKEANELFGGFPRGFSTSLGSAWFLRRFGPLKRAAFAFALAHGFDAPLNPSIRDILIKNISKDKRNEQKK